MPNLHQIALCIFGTFTLSSLVGCSDNSIAIKSPTSSVVPSVIATNTAPISSSTATTTPEAVVAQVTGNLLSLEQKVELKKLTAPIVVPTYLPAGFRLIKVNSGREELRAGSYSYYSILYQGADDTCLDISLNTDPAMVTSRLQKTMISVPISSMVTILSGHLEAKPITLGLFQLPNGEKNSQYMLRTGDYMPSSQQGKNIRCNSVSSEEYGKILQALEILNLDGISNDNESPTKKAIALNDSNPDNLLSAEQKTQLSQLGIEVILPTYLPSGVKVSKFEAYKKRTSATDDYSFYNIQYTGADNTCIEAGSGYQTMWQKNPTKSQVDTKVGVVEISSGTHSRSGTLQYWGTLRQSTNGQALITGGRSSTGQPCEPISFEEYNKVLQSLEVLPSKPQ